METINFIAHYSEFTAETLQSGRRDYRISGQKGVWTQRGRSGASRTLQKEPGNSKFNCKVPGQ